MPLTRKLNHVEVITSHELYVHRLPRAGRIGRPSNMASRAFVEGISRSWRIWDRVCKRGEYGQNGSEEDGLEHDDCFAEGGELYNEIFHKK